MEDSIMFSIVYGRALSILKQKPFRLWGISLMGTLLTGLATILGVLPIISLPIVALLEFGLTCVFLNAYRGQEFSNEQLFTGFNKNCGRIAGGILWMMLWVFIWSLIPIAGIVLGIMKAYSYRFVPYILRENPDISATAALKKSMEMTKGHRGAMFGCDIAFVGIALGALIVLGLLSAIPYVGVLFAVIWGIVYFVFCIISPLMLGLLSAGYYQEISTGNTYIPYQTPVTPQQPQQAPTAPIPPFAQEEAMFCPTCGAKLKVGSAFCPGCGTKL